MSEIENQLSILESHSTSASVDLLAIVRDLGLKLLHADLGSDVAGIIKKDLLLGGETGFVIFVNSEDGPRRRRFTIAHEIAHYILHKNFIGDGIKEDATYRSKLSDVFERQANKFAANILMPTKLIVSLMKEYKDDYALAAKKLEVSKRALQIQLHQLRYPGFANI